MALILRLLLFWVMVFNITVYGDDHLKIKLSGVDQKDQYGINLFIEKAISKLPPMMVDSLSKEEIKIVFDTLSPELTELPKDKCEGSVSFRYATTNILNKSITLNKLLISQIIDGNEREESFHCGHKNYYSTAIGTLIHELGHLYDHQNIQKARISDDLSFYRLAGWKRGVTLTSSSKNLSHRRSPDAYELSSLDEHYAVNLEYFLMEPDYKCKRPTYYDYYSSHFNYIPFPDHQCDVNTTVQLDDTKRVINIDPDRVYRIDYLLASKGDELISGFGHSMFRIVMCAPFRKVVNSRCAEDKLYHIVISFRANIDDIKSNPLKGLVGNYDSILFLFSFPKVIEEYNSGELRDLYSLPLNLSEIQKKRFIYKTLELFWGYSGSYKFITSNCASESNELLQAALYDHPIIHKSVIKPYSLWDLLIKKGLASDGLFIDREKAKKEGLLFESDANLYSELKLELLGDQKSDYKWNRVFIGRERVATNKFQRGKRLEIKEILRNIDAFSLVDLLDSFEDEEVSNELRAKYSSVAVLSDAILKIKQHDLDEKIGSYLEKIENDPTALGESIRKWNEKRKKFRLSPLKPDYGIPLHLTDEDFKFYESEIKQLESTEKILIDDVIEKFSDEVNELRNMTQIRGESRYSRNLMGVDLFMSKVKKNN